MSDDKSVLEYFAEKSGLAVPLFLAKMSAALSKANIVIHDKTYQVITPEEKQAIDQFLKLRFGSAAPAAAPVLSAAAAKGHRERVGKAGGATITVRGKRHVDFAAIKRAEEEKAALLKKVAEAKANVSSVEGLTASPETATVASVSEVAVSDEASATTSKPAEKGAAEKPGLHRKPTYLAVKKSKEDLEEESRLEKLNKNRYAKKSSHRFSTSVVSKPVEKIIRDVRVLELNTIPELAAKMAVQASVVIKTLMQMGYMATINQPIEQDIAYLVAEELGHRPLKVSGNELEEKLVEYTKGSGLKKKRPPVVTIMGHVDHGKTSLLDHIRQTRVTAGEAGGITQHIGAYHVETPRGVITFLDTPGHETFSAMRARGAKLTDIVILVVAADDGVMPQTIEALQHAQSAKVPVIVAVNKIDKPDANPDKVKQELLGHNIIAEEFGGETMVVGVSAKTGQGIDDLLEHILLQADVMDLQAEDDCAAQGVVIESRRDKGRGVIASVLVQAGHLKQGDIVLAGLQYGKVRRLLNELGKNIDEAGPSIPVEVLGLSDAPGAGDEFVVLPSLALAEKFAKSRSIKDNLIRLAGQRLSKDNMFQKLDIGEQLNVIIKADVQGSAEALKEALKKLKVEKDAKDITVNVISASVGAIFETDVNFAATSKALIIGFNVRAEKKASEKIRNEAVDVMYGDIIYEIINMIRQRLNGIAGPLNQDNILGLAHVRQVFRSDRFGQVAGCVVSEGVIKRGALARVLRDNAVIFSGELRSLRRHKEEVNEVLKGFDCGLGMKNYTDIREGDQIETFEVIKVERTL